jgi:methyl-accepting chemotaxis protein
MAADRAEMMAPFREGLRLSVILTAVFLILSIIFAIILSNSIGRPINKISCRLELLSKGDLEQPCTDNKI